MPAATTETEAGEILSAKRMTRLRSITLTTLLLALLFSGGCSLHDVKEMPGVEGGLFWPVQVRPRAVPVRPRNWGRIGSGQPA